MAIPKLFIDILKAREKLHRLIYNLKEKNTGEKSYYRQNLAD